MADYRFAALVLAAGAAERFGSPKQLADFRGRPLLQHAVAAATSATAVARVVVVLGAHADEILRAIDLQGAEAVVIDDWEEGQAASLRAGVRALAHDADAIVVLLGDQPLITPKLLDDAIAAWRPDVDAVRTTFEGRPGHPVVLGRSLFELVQSLSGDTGARGLLQGSRVREISAGGEATADVDTPEQLERLRHQG